MRAAVVALACLLRFAVPAQAAEPPRAELQPASTGPATPVADPTAGDANAPKVAPPHDPAKPSHPDDAHRDAGHARVCFNAAQTRETVASHRLSEPFRALRVGGQQGEALRARLCRWKQDEWVYEISVLRRDGRIVHVYMNAQNGQAVGSLDSNDRH